MIYDAQLREDRGLIPMDMLIGHFASLKLNDADQDELNFSFRGWKARKHPIHIERVRKANHELFNDPVVIKYLRHRIEFEIRRDLRQELIGIELVHTCPTHAAHPEGTRSTYGFSIMVASAASGSLSTNSARVCCCHVANIVC